MREIRTSGSMSGDGKRIAAPPRNRARPRLYHQGGGLALRATDDFVTDWEAVKKCVNTVREREREGPADPPIKSGEEGEGRKVDGLRSVASAH
jgi:hypothetical protein